MRKSRALAMALNREKKKVLGHDGIIPKTVDTSLKTCWRSSRLLPQGPLPSVHGLCGCGQDQINAPIYV
jgi:hypothetical protein